MSMYSKIIDLQKLDQAWEKARKNKPSAGVDGISYEQFHNNKKENLKQLQTELKEHRYQALPVKLTTIYKGEKERVIAQYSMRDKVVQQSLAAELNRMFDHMFTAQTYAYRPAKSALHAIEELGEKAAEPGFSSFLKIDISKYFDRIQWDILKTDIEKYVSEEDVIGLIRENACAASLDTMTGELMEKRCGIYQGSGIAPILSNIYLMEFDRWLFSQKDIYFIRYSDDMILLTESVERSMELLQEITARLQLLGLQINDKKSVLGKVEEGFDFLGYHFDRGGKAIPAKAEQDLTDRLEMMWLSSGDIGTEDKLKKALEIVGGWEQYFRGEREIGSVFEYAALVYVNEGNDAQLQKLKERRGEFPNIYRDLMQYLSSVWRAEEENDLELLEYEQYFRIWKEDQKEKRPTQLVKELADIYRRYVILESVEDSLELMQLYSDLKEYEKAEYWQRISEKQKKEQRGGGYVQTIRIAGEILPVYDRTTAGRMLSVFAGREDMYSTECMGTDRNRRIDLQTRPLTEEVLKEHLQGNKTIGTYLQRPNGTVRSMVFDVDISKKVLLQHDRGTEEFKKYMEKASGKALEIIKVLRDMGIVGYMEYSGCRGYHIWIFFTEWVPARYQVLLMETVTAQLEKEDGDIAIECFPGKMKQKPGKPGQPIKIPYGIHGRTGERSYFIDEGGEPIVNINHFVDGLSKTSPEVLKRVIAASFGKKAVHDSMEVDMDLEAFGDIPVSIREVLEKCNLIRYLCQKSVKTAYLTHFERLSLLYVFGHMGEEGQKFIHKVMSFTLNYQYQITEKFIRKVPEKPISCPKLRDQYKNLTAEIGCSCDFRHSKNCYPSPVLHAVSLSKDLQPDITLPTSRTLTKEKEQSVMDEINIHKKAQQLAGRILELKKQKRGLDKNIEKLEGELNEIFQAEKIDCLEIEMGLLVRRKTEAGIEWVIEI